MPNDIHQLHYEHEKIVFSVKWVFFEQVLIYRKKFSSNIMKFPGVNEHSFGHWFILKIISDFKRLFWFHVGAFLYFISLSVSCFTSLKSAFLYRQYLAFSDLFFLKMNKLIVSSSYIKKSFLPSILKHIFFIKLFSC